MNKLFLITTTFLICFFTGSTQKLEIIPKLGIHYFGLSYISKGDLKPEDFKGSVLELDETFGIDVKLKGQKFTHVFGFHKTNLGVSFTFRDLYNDNVPGSSFGGHRAVRAIDNILIGYNLQKSTKEFERFIGQSSTKIFYSLGVAISFNKSKAYYNEVLEHQYVSGGSGDSYWTYDIAYKRIGIGGFISGRAGYDFYTKNKHHFLTFEAFWDQGLIKMQENTIGYWYGNTNAPQNYRRVENILLKSRGTNFGFVLGVPITILK